MNSEEIVIICSCSKQKLSNPAPAKYLYQGVLFKKIKKLAQYKKLDFRILSAKYGILNPNELIKPYDKTIKSKRDIINLRKKIMSAVKKIETDYSLIILIMGKKYRMVFEPFLNNPKYKMIYDSRGIGGLTAKVKEYTNKPLDNMIKNTISCNVT